MGEREDSPFSATHHRNPKPRCGPSPSEPTPNFAPQGMPSPRPVSVHLPTWGFEVGGGVPKVPNYNSQSPPGPRRGGTSWFSPNLADSPCIPVSSLPGQRLPASTHPAITPLPKRCQVVHCFQSQHLTPYSQSWLFSSQGERTVPPRDFPRTPSFSAIICPLLKKVCLDLAALSNRTFCSDRDVLYLHCPTLATDDH